MMSNKEIYSSIYTKYLQGTGDWSVDEMCRDYFRLTDIAYTVALESYVPFVDPKSHLSPSPDVLYDIIIDAARREKAQGREVVTSPASAKFFIVKTGVETTDLRHKATREEIENAEFYPSVVRWINSQIKRISSMAASVKATSPVSTVRATLIPVLAEFLANFGNTKESAEYEEVYNRLGA